MKAKLPTEVPGIPEPIALIICNEVIEDKRTNNKTLVGLFNRIYVADIPATHPRMFIVASLTGLTGTVPISFRISSPTTEIARLNGKAESDDPEAVLDVVVELRDLPISELGTHSIEVLANDVPIARRRFEIAGAETE